MIVDKLTGCCSFCCVISESFSFTRKPADPTVVVEGINNTQVKLVWDFTAASASFFVSIFRQRIGDLQQVQIAARTHDTAFQYADPSLSTEYSVQLPATLVIKDINRTNEFGYNLKVLTSLFIEKLFDHVTVNVLCK